MATKLNAGDFKRTDLFLVDPTEILVKEEDRGRFEPPTEQQIINLALSLLTNGQLQPVAARKIEGDRLKLVMGYTRMAAIRLIRDGFTYEGKTYHDPEFLIKVVLKSGNDEDAFKQNIVENCHRNQTSPIDDAHNQDRLRDRYGMSDADIAALYLCSVVQVTRIAKLLNLTRDQQMLVHEGVLPFTAAIDILDLPEDKRDEAIEAAKTESGKVSGTGVRKIVRDQHLRDNADKPATPGEPKGKSKTKSRSIGELKTFFEKQSEEVGFAGEVATSMIAFIKGELSEEKMLEVFTTIKSFAYAA